MKAVAFLGKGQTGIIEVSKPKIAPGEALVRVTRSAICGSDLGTDHAGFLAERKEPAIIGHESVGIIEENGDTAFKIGQKVAILVVKGCMDCPACRRGSFTLCNSAGGIPQTNAEYVAVAEANLILLPEDISFEKGLLGFGCGIGVALGAVKKLPFKPGEMVGVMGLGPIGLCAVEVLKHYGIRAVAIDMNKYRLETAKKLGAELLFNPKDTTFDSIRTIEKGGGLKSVILCTGSSHAAATALDILAKEGLLVLLGAPSLSMVGTFNHIVAKEIKIHGSWHYGMEDVPEILSILRNVCHPELILTHSFPKEECQAAYELFARGECGKVLLNWE